MNKPIDTRTPKPDDPELLGTGKIIIGEQIIMGRPTCESCPYWKFSYTTGHCFVRSVDDAEFPERFDDDFCGEHPDFPAYLESLRSEGEPESVCKPRTYAKGPIGAVCLRCGHMYNMAAPKGGQRCPVEGCKGIVQLVMTENPD